MIFKNDKADEHLKTYSLFLNLRNFPVFQKISKPTKVKETTRSQVWKDWILHLLTGMHNVC